MASIRSGETQLAFQQFGTGPDVVMLHGLATNRAFWYASHAQDIAQAGFRVTLFDLRGHGYSDMPERGYSAVDMADDLAAVMNGLGLRSAFLIGHSYGGGVALEYAARSADRVDGLALLDTRVQRVQPEQWLQEGPALTPFEEAVLAAAPADWDRETQIGLRYLESLARLTVAGASLPRMGVWTPFGEGRGGVRSAKQFVRLLDLTRAQQEFVIPGAPTARIHRALRDAPLLLLYGDASRCRPTQTALAELLPQAQCATLENAGHFFPATHREHTGILLRAWLRAASSAGQRRAVS